MGKVKYKTPSAGMNRMVVQLSEDSRPSIGLTEVKAEIYFLSPDLIIPYKNQARRGMDETSLNELAQSIISHGIIQPLQVVRSLLEDGKFEVVSGERRLRASRIAGIEKIPCIILDREKDANEIALIENIQRVDLHPIELADAIAKTLLDKKYENQTTLANRIGVSKQQISHLIAISRLQQDVKEHLLKNKGIKIAELRKIAYLNDEKLIRDRVFGSADNIKKYSSILRISYNGVHFKFDQLKIEKLDITEKDQLRDELLKLLDKLGS